MHPSFPAQDVREGRARDAQGESGKEGRRHKSRVSQRAFLPASLPASLPTLPLYTPRLPSSPANTCKLHQLPSGAPSAPRPFLHISDNLRVWWSVKVMLLAFKAIKVHTLRFAARRGRRTRSGASQTAED